MHACKCDETHRARRIVVTGGPGAGKTAILELIRMAFCRHVRVLPEAAGVVFGGGFPRTTASGPLRAAQRAIYHVQSELEATAEDENLAILLCDRGTIDGLAYWPGPSDYWAEINTDPATEFQRYHAVIHLRTPGADGGYNHRNPLRIESAEEARQIDERIAALWAEHPKRFEVPATEDFLEKARRTMVILRKLTPGCCPSSLSFTA